MAEDTQKPEMHKFASVERMEEVFQQKLYPKFDEVLDKVRERARAAEGVRGEEPLRHTMEELNVHTVRLEQGKAEVLMETARNLPREPLMVKTVDVELKGVERSEVRTIAKIPSVEVTNQRMRDLHALGENVLGPLPGTPKDGSQVDRDYVAVGKGEDRRSYQVFVNQRPEGGPAVVVITDANQMESNGRVTPDPIDITDRSRRDEFREAGKSVTAAPPAWATWVETEQTRVFIHTRDGIKRDGKQVVPPDTFIDITNSSRGNGRDLELVLTRDQMMELFKGRLDMKLPDGGVEFEAKKLFTSGPADKLSNLIANDELKRAGAVKHFWEIMAAQKDLEARSAEAQATEQAILGATSIGKERIRVCTTVEQVTHRRRELDALYANEAKRYPFWDPRRYLVTPGELLKIRTSFVELDLMEKKARTELSDIDRVIRRPDVQRDLKVELKTRTERAVAIRRDHFEAATLRMSAAAVERGLERLVSELKELGSTEVHLRRERVELSKEARGPRAIDTVQPIDRSLFEKSLAQVRARRAEQQRTR